jgi:DNA-binding NarL/FixJ family response regulator
MTPLSPQLRKVADLVVAGLTNSEIAEQMHLSDQTVRGYVSEVYARTGARHRGHLMQLRLLAQGPRPFESMVRATRQAQQHAFPISPRE